LAEADEAFDLVILMFDGRDEAALAHARGQWRRLKDQGRAISYWRESDEGGLGASAVGLGFLGAHRLAANSPISGYWIVLDSLGFSRQNRDLSMGYAGSSTENFARGLSLKHSPGGDPELTILAYEGLGLFMGQSLA
jgi:hypothetical protein